MYSLITKSAVLLSILALLSLASASAELKRVPLILMDHGLFDFRNMTTADLEGTGTSTHLGKIVSTGVFENVGNRRSGGFKGEIEELLLPFQCQAPVLQLREPLPVSPLLPMESQMRLHIACRPSSSLGGSGCILRHWHVSNYWRKWCL
jgi:hypothetical protein